MAYDYDNPHEAKRAAKELAGAIIERIIDEEATLKAIVKAHNRLVAERNRGNGDEKRPAYLSASRLLATEAKRRNLPPDMAAAIADASFYAKEPTDEHSAPQKPEDYRYVPVSREQRLVVRQGQLLRHVTLPDNWLIRAFVGRNVNGKKQYKSEVIRGSQLEAEKALRELLASRKRMSPELAAFTVAEYVREVYLPDVKPKLAGSTFKLYRGDLEVRVIPYVGSRRLGTLSKRDLGILEEHLMVKGVAHTTARASVAALKRVMRHAAKRGLNAPAIWPGEVQGA